ncbi:ATP-binding protein [Bifidobacterium choloepi]|uniref:ATP-binding protein n=1 Tax=Bifidobacterium choloepi TaxID=2614131 RepID=A0A6I5NP61_9BIFI|nr:ATP-binding protein [Bifidobacterium choloepi]NEG70492.1 ATP-binding protein [Bifidobacterium choloepi]
MVIVTDTVYVSRTVQAQVEQLMQWYPVVSVTGPRQSGKSTMLRRLFPDYDYINLERLQNRQAALLDPAGFIEDRPNHLIIDEAQYVPDLFSSIQAVVDEQKIKGEYILSGSQNFLLSKNIQQSLAGRVGIVKMPPLTFSEIVAGTSVIDDLDAVDEFTFRGGYPELVVNSIPSRIYFQNYVDTYIARDVTQFLDVRNRDDFIRFLRLCAENAGQTINYAAMSSVLGVDYRTVKAWISILESSYITFHLQPYHSNGTKRLVKTPKLYFYDTGLLCYLLNIDSSRSMLLDQHFGAIFENMVIAEQLKTHLDRGWEPRLFFYRDQQQREIDLLDFTMPDQHQIVEIKSGRTYHERFSRHLRSVGNELGIPAFHRHVVCRTEMSFRDGDIAIDPVNKWLIDQ